MTAGTTRTGTDPDLTPADSADLVPADDLAQLDPAGLLSRRTVFAVGSAGAIALGLAACGSSSSGDASASAPTSPAAAPATPGAAETSPATSNSAPTKAAPSPGGKTGGTKLTKVSAVPVGGAIGLHVNGKPIIVAQPTAGNVVAFSAVCPHQGCTVAPDGKKPLLCPCHSSTFAVATGKNISGPANGRPLTPIEVEVSGGEVTLKA